jgi:2-polyprenyl-3-methyl-5-hydroxy-6-metoxy-1,4-benzoquinol methylase
VASIADIGAGQGNMARLVARADRPVLMVDDFEPVELPDNCQWIRTDLNNHWGLDDQQFDFVFALEVIEHLENPRHFFRELVKIMKPGAYGFVSTPNNEGFFSKLNFLVNSQHRWFQDSSYPAHITPVLKIDLTRILIENKLELRQFYYGMHDYIPKLGIPLRIPGPLFSRTVGVLFQKIYA